MEKRTLGKTGMQVSILGFGGSEIGYDNVPHWDSPAIHPQCRRGRNGHCGHHQARALASKCRVTGRRTPGPKTIRSNPYTLESHRQTPLDWTGVRGSLVLQYHLEG